MVYKGQLEFDVPFGFAGGLHDRDTGLVRFGYRDYDSDTGRWAAKDPILFASDNIVLYRYVNNDPINFIDPWGLTQEDVERAKMVLKIFHPEYYNDNAIVSFGNLSSKYEAITDIWTGEITLSNKFKEVLDYDDQINLLETLAHEYQHSNDSVFRRLIDCIADRFGCTTKNHWRIYLTSIDLSEESYNAMYVPYSDSICQ